MNKTEARAAIRRARQALRDMEDAISRDGWDDLEEAISEAYGSIAMVEDFKDSKI